MRCYIFSTQDYMYALQNRIKVAKAKFINVQKNIELRLYFFLKFSYQKKKIIRRKNKLTDGLFLSVNTYYQLT